MRYFKYIDFDEKEKIVSEEEIKKTFFPYWETRMIDKFGMDTYLNRFSFEDCIEDWMTYNCASLK